MNNSGRRDSLAFDRSDFGHSRRLFHQLPRATHDVRDSCERRLVRSDDAPLNAGKVTLVDIGLVGELSLSPTQVQSSLHHLNGKSISTFEDFSPAARLWGEACPPLSTCVLVVTCHTDRLWALTHNLST